MRGSVTYRLLLFGIILMALMTGPRGVYAQEEPSVFFRKYRLSADLVLSHAYRGTFSNTFLTEQRAVNPGGNVGMEVWLWQRNHIFTTLGVHYGHYDFVMRRPVPERQLEYILHQWADQAYLSANLYVDIIPAIELYVVGSLRWQWWKEEHYHYMIWQAGQLIYEDKNVPVNHVLFLSPFNAAIGFEKAWRNNWYTYLTVEQSAKRHH